MNRDELMRRLSATFIEEIAEHVRVFNSELLLIERDTEPARRATAIHSLFRAAHSLKGAARAVSATEIESVAHKLEDLLSRIRDGRRALTPDLFQILFAAADGFEQAGRRFAVEGAGNLGLASLSGRLERTLLLADSPAGDAPDSRAPASILPSAPEPPAAVGADSDRGTPPSSRVATSQGGFVRISHTRLDALLRQGSELSLARRCFEKRREQLAAVQEQLSRMRAEWIAGGRALRRVEKERALGAGVLPGALFALPKRVERWLVNTGDELLRLTRAVDSLSVALREDEKALARAAAPLEAQIHQLGLLPFAQACEGLSRVVRDLATTQQKQVELCLEGAETELDRAIVDGLREPLLQLVRNAIDHGIETPDLRAKAGKPPRATLSIRALVVGDSLEVSVADDGRGLDLAAIQERLGETFASDDSATLAPERAIFLPGFSTARTVSNVSGRGVGLDVVKTAVERMNGRTAVRTSQAGTLFALTLPLSLSTSRVLVVRVAGDVLAVPSAAVEVLLRVEPGALKYVAERALVIHSGGPIPLASLATVLKLPGGSTEPGGALSAVVLCADGRRAALVVDEFLSEEDVVLKALGPRLQGLAHVTSVTLLSTGDVAPVLSPSTLLAAALDLPALALSNGVRLERDQRKRLLLADDSLTTRALERSILEAAGYDVVVAVDGLSAWQLLQERGADLVLSDVEMPKMDGLSLTQNIRGSTRFRDLPVILLTSRDSQDDKARGLEAGASAYLVKSAFDQSRLLQTIEELL